MLPMRYGIVKMAAKANVPIVPISIHYVGDRIYSRVGEPLMVTTDKEAIMVITSLRDIMATMKYVQIEACGVYKRTDVDKKDFEALVKDSLDEYPTFKREYEEISVFNN